LFWFPALVLYGQSPATNFFVKGRVVDSTGKAIPYVNIGIKEKNIGTVSDITGNFEIKITSSYLTEKLEISSIGYQHQVLALQQLASADSNKLIEIRLAATYQQLQDVVITPKELRVKVLGNTTKSKFLSGGFSSSDLGAEAGTHIKIKRPSHLEKVDFHISYNKLDSIKVRLNIYAMKNKELGENILPENVIINLGNKQTGNIEIDLSKYNLVAKDDILVALELVEVKGDAKSSVFVSSSILGTPTYYRETSQAKWKIYKGLSIGINITVKY